MSGLAVERDGLAGGVQHLECLELAVVQIAGLDGHVQRDKLAIKIKDDLNSAAFGDQAINGVNGLTVHCQAIIASAQSLAHHL